MAVQGGNLHHRDVIRNPAPVAVGVLKSDVSGTAVDVEHRGVEVGEGALGGAAHRHLTDTGIEYHTGLDPGIVGDGEHLSATAGLSHSGDLLKVDEMIVLTLGIGILVREPVQSLQKLPGICTERSRSGFGVLLVPVLLGSCGGGLLRGFALGGLRRQLSLGGRGQPLSVPHDGYGLGLGIPSSHHAFPLLVETLVRHVLVRSDGKDEVAVRGDFTQETAHLEAVVGAGAVGIKEYRDLAVGGYIAFEVQRTVDHVRRKAGVAYGSGLVLSRSSVFNDLELVGLG